MADRDAAFVGSIPENYDRYLGPIFFRHYADDLVARLPVTPGMRVLETACGTGILTERLVRRLAGQGTVVATDLNEPMIAHAQRKLPRAPHLKSGKTPLGLERFACPGLGSWVWGGLGYKFATSDVWMS